MSKSGLKTLKDVRSGREPSQMSGIGLEALQDVQEWSGVSPG